MQRAKPPPASEASDRFSENVAGVHDDEAITLSFDVGHGECSVTSVAAGEVSPSFYEVPRLRLLGNKDPLSGSLSVIQSHARFGS